MTQARSQASRQRQRTPYGKAACPSLSKRQIPRPTKPTKACSQPICQPKTSQALRPPSKVAQRNQRTRVYLELVKPIALFYANCSPEPLEDLLQVGLLGLMRAAELFNLAQKTPFEAFAKPHIRGSILHYLRDLAQPIRLPRRHLELKDRLNRHGLDRLSSMGLSPGDQRRLEELATWARPLSLDAALEDGLCIAPAPEQPGSSAAEGQQALALLGHLEPQLQVVIRHVVLSGWSYRRTADVLKVSPMTIQRRLKRGLGLLKQALDGPGIGPSTLSPGTDCYRAASAVPGC